MIQKTPKEVQKQPNINAIPEIDQIDPDYNLLPMSIDVKTKNQWLSGGRSLLLGMGIGVILAVGTTHLLSRQKPSKAIATSSSNSVSLAPAQTVTVAEVETSPINRSLEATGTVAAFELIPVLSQALGLQIQQILADEGDFVKAGQVLARLDNSVLQAQLNQAQAALAQSEARLAELRAGTRIEEIARARENVRSAEAAVVQAKSDLDLAKKRVQRNQNLEAEGAIARDRLDEILNRERIFESSLQQAQARLREAQQQLAQLKAGPRREVIIQAEAQVARDKGQIQLVMAQMKDTRVVAPVSGKIAERNARVGDVTRSLDSQRLFSIIQNGRLELRLKVPETQLPLISVGQNVEITSDANSSMRLVGKVQKILPVVDEESRIATVSVDLPSQNTLKPGMFLRASVITSKLQGLTVPTEAVLPQADGSAIAYVLQDDNTVKAESVEMGEILPGEKVEIKSGLKRGDRLVVKGAPFLKDGDRVEIADNL